MRVSVYLHGLPSRRATAIVANSSGVVWSLPPKPPPTSGAMIRTFDSGMPVVAATRKRRMCGTCVERPHRHLLTGRVAHRRARLHEGGDEPLLAELALDDDAAVAGLGDLVLDVGARPLGGGVEGPDGGGVGAEVGVREHLVLDGLLEVEDGRQLVVVDVDELGGVAGLGRGAGRDDGDDLAGARDVVDDDGQVVRASSARR